MVEVTDSDIAAGDNVHLFRSTAPEPQPRRTVRSKDRRATARQAKRRSKIKPDRDASAAKAMPVYAPPIAPIATRTDGAGVTLPAPVTPPEWRTIAPKQTVERAPRYASIPLAVIAYGFFVLGIGINVWNAWNAGPIANVLLPAAMGVLAEALMFFLPERTLSLPWAGKLLAGVFLLFVAAFALTNSLRMANIVSADQAAARADRQTEGVGQPGPRGGQGKARRCLRPRPGQDRGLPVASGRSGQAGGETDPGHQQGRRPSQT